MPSRSPKMKRRIFGFQRRVWWPKWTPASSSSLMPTLWPRWCSLVDCGGDARRPARGPGVESPGQGRGRRLRRGRSIGACSLRKVSGPHGMKRGGSRSRLRCACSVPVWPLRRLAPVWLRSSAAPQVQRVGLDSQPHRSAPVTRMAERQPRGVQELALEAEPRRARRRTRGRRRPGGRSPRGARGSGACGRSRAARAASVRARAALARPRSG